MIIKLKDGTETVVTKEQANKAERAIESGAIGIKVNDLWVRCDWIAVIKPGGATVVDESRLLDTPDHRGIDSPNKEKLRELWGKPLDNKQT